MSSVSMLPAEEARALAQRASDAATRFGTPAYVYDLNLLDRTIQHIEAALDGIDWQLRYFEFANRNPAILERVRDLGHGLCTSRPTGVARALQLGFKPEHVELSGFGLTDQELVDAVRAGVSINIGSGSELARAAELLPGVPLGLRVDLGGPLLDKRGIEIDRALDALRATPVRLAGIHTYIGTNVSSTDVHIETVRALLSLLDALPDEARRELRYINVGGGFGYDYATRRHFGWDEYGEMARALLAGAMERIGRPLTLKLEVGRSLVVDCGCLVTRVNHAFEKDGQLFLAVDSNLSHCGRPARYGFDEQRPPYSEAGRQTIVVLDVPDEGRAPASRRAAVVGNSHYSRDWFGYAEVEACDPKRLVGRRLVLLDVGAYCEAMSDHWADEPRPPVVVIDGSEVRLGTERERLEDLVRPARGARRAFRDAGR